jgi:hypothetical protein
MPDLIERHEIRVPLDHSTIVFVADSQDGRLCIRQEPKGKKADDVCTISLADPEELRGFFQGLRKILEVLGHTPTVASPKP